MDKIVFTILGCGSSGGVPRLGNNWGACDPNNPKNRRRRCSMLVQRFGRDGLTSVLIDTGPDMREQLLDTDVKNLDAIIYTHDHADHVHGLDDLRMLFLANNRKPLPVYADSQTEKSLQTRFSYAFVQPENSDYPVILTLNPLPQKLRIDGAGGVIDIESYPVLHGRGIVQAIKINKTLYTPDISGFFEENPPFIYNLNCWIIDSLRLKLHSAHFNLEQALKWLERADPKQAVLTNLHVDLDYAQLNAQTPAHIQPAYDGLQLHQTLNE